MAKSETSVSDSQENDPDSSSDDHVTDIDGGTEKIPEYERQRRKTIEQNRAKMEALGLNRFSSSLMGLVQKPTKKTDAKGKKKIDEEDEEYMPVDEEDRSASSSEEDDDNFSGGENSRSRTSKAKGKYPPKKKLVGDSDFVDDDESLMQAIALSLEHSAEMVCSELPRSSDACLNNDLENERKRKSCSEKDLEKRKKRKPQVTSRVQMTENELVVHFFLFDEAGKGNIIVQDIQRLATAHDFAWTDKEMADMITFFVSNADAKAKGKYPPKKKFHGQKLVGNSDFVDDDESLMQAIALSLEHSAEMVCSELSRSSDACLNDDLENERRKSCSEKDLEKRKKRKPQVTSRVQMTEDELVLHFFLFDGLDQETCIKSELVFISTRGDGFLILLEGETELNNYHLGVVANLFCCILLLVPVLMQRA